MPTAPPNALYAVAMNASTLNLFWSPPNVSDINGIIRHYRINVSVMETLEQYQYTALTTNFTINGLHPYYTYTVLVAAVTIGAGPFTPGRSIRMPQDGMFIIFMSCFLFIIISSQWAPSKCYWSSD